MSKAPGRLPPAAGSRLVAEYYTIVAIFYPFSQFCEINISLLSLQKQPNTAPNLFQREVEYGKYVHTRSHKNEHAWGNATESPLGYSTENPRWFLRCWFLVCNLLPLPIPAPPAASSRREPCWRQPGNCYSRDKSLGFEGFDSSRLLILRGGNSHVRRIW